MRIPAELVDEVRAALARDIEQVFEVCGAELRGRGRNRRTNVCPACGTRSRWDAVRLSVDRGWVCACCGAKGDAVKALALFAQLDDKRDFAEVIRRGADLVGIELVESADPAVRDRRRAELARAREARAAERRAREEQEWRDQAAAILNAARWWPQLDESSATGQAYLASRGLDPVALMRAKAVRFGRGGDPAVALHDVTGGVINIVRRVIDPGDGPKVVGLKSCPGEGTLVGRITDIEQGSTVVLVEGVVDSLTAVLAFPGAVVLGAHGVVNYGDVASMAARRLVRVGGGWLRYAFDNDDAGRAAVDETIDAILAAELDISATDVVDFGDHHDLNDAWRAGWRP